LLPSQETVKAKAVTATIHKIVVLFFNNLRHGMEYSDPGAPSNCWTEAAMARLVSVHEIVECSQLAMVQGWPAQEESGFM